MCDHRHWFPYIAHRELRLDICLNCGKLRYRIVR